MRRIALTITLLAAIGLLIALPAMTGAEEKSPQRLEARTLNRMIENQENLMLIHLSGYLSCMDARIPASVCMSCDGEQGQPDVFPEKKETKLVFYHVSPSQEPDCAAISEAQRRGFTRIYVLKGGLPAWRKAGYDTESIERVPRAAGLAIKPVDLAAWKNSVHKALVLDIRSAEAFRRQHIEGALNIPFSVLHLRYPDIPLDHTLLVVDEDGAKSFLAAGFLSRKGFAGAARMNGGMSAWNDYVRRGRTK